MVFGARANRSLKAVKKYPHTIGSKPAELNNSYRACCRLGTARVKPTVATEECSRAASWHYAPDVVARPS